MRLFLSFLVLLFSFQANSAVVRATSFEEVKSGVDSIVYATVRAKTSLYRSYREETPSGRTILVTEDDEVIFTRYDLDVHQVISGEEVNRTVALWHFGGQVGDDRLRSTDGFELKEGDRIVIPLVYDELNESYVSPYGAQAVFLNVPNHSANEVFISLLDRRLSSALKEKNNEFKHKPNRNLSLKDWVRPEKPEAYTFRQLLEVFNNEQ